MIDWKFIGTAALQITGCVLAGLLILVVAALIIKGYGALLCGS